MTDLESQLGKLQAPCVSAVYARDAESFVLLYDAATSVSKG